MEAHQKRVAAAIGMVSVVLGIGVLSLLSLFNFSPALLHTIGRVDSSTPESMLKCTKGIALLHPSVEETCIFSIVYGFYMTVKDQVKKMLSSKSRISHVSLVAM